MPNRAKKILIIDQDFRDKQSLKRILEKYYIVLTCDNIEEALSVLKLVEIDVLLLKPVRPFRASEIIRLQKAFKDTEIFMVVDEAFLIEGKIVFKDLVKGFISRPFDAKTVLEKISYIQDEADNSSLFPEEDSELLSKLEKFGSEIVDKVKSAIHSNFPVIIQGESGTGKAEIARIIHESGIRSNSPFFRISCKALTSKDLEKALFGYFDEFGKKIDGKFSLAHKGTLFIEDIESMVLDTQLKFLDFIERGKLGEINGERTILLDVRIITSTSKDLIQSVEANEFLEELYLRLSVITIHLKPLRKRTEELPRLIEMTMRDIKKATGFTEKSFTSELIKKLQDYDWPGNIVELETAIKRGLVLTRKDRITNIEGLFDKRWKKSFKKLKKDYSPPFNGLLIQKFSNLMSSIDNLDIFLENIIEVFSEIMDIEKIAIFLLEENNHLVLKSSLGFSDNEIELLKSLKLKQDLSVFEKLQDCPSVVYRDNEEEKVRELTTLLKLLDASFCIPLIVKNKIIGLYIFGEKRSRESYSHTEMDNLLKLTSQTSKIISDLIGDRDILKRIERVSVVLEKAQWGVLLIDNKGVITNFNSKVLEILGYEEKDILKKGISVLDANLEHLIMNAIKEERTYFRYETRWMPKLGKWIPVSVGFSLLKDNKGNIYGGIIVFYDLSIIEKAKIVKKDLSEYKIMDEMATRLAHVVKNPLVSIKTFLQLWPEKFTDSEFRVNYYNVVLQEVDRLNNFVEDISRLTYPLQLSLNRNNINDIINSILLNYKEELLTKKIEISEEYLREIPDIRFDKKEITRALSNIILNAIQSMQKGGFLSIRTDTSTAREKRYMEIQISDTGCGISQDSLKRITIPFFTTKPGSLGLGLTIASKIVGAHKGRITVRSSKDKGSTFIIFIPIDL